MKVSGTIEDAPVSDISGYDKVIQFHTKGVIPIKLIIKVYRGEFQGTPTLVRAPRAQAKKIENKNLGFFLRYLTNYCAAQCSVGFMSSFCCSLVGPSAT